ncbi:MAG: outer membrane lipoprotein-sorting protein [Bacteriovorax sp.]|nr:outer membrane lipoprotein-sorting protein [Bacteriovorax sp.]
MKNTLFFLALVLLFSLPVIAEISPNEIVKKADFKRGLGTISHSLNVSVTDQDNKKDVYHVSVKDSKSTLTEQMEPERARGRKMLMKEYDIWLFTPNIKKAVRISLEQKLTGEVSNGDVATTNYAEDYEAKILGLEKLNNIDTYHLELIAKNNKVTYRKIEYIVSQKDFTPMKATYFALSGKTLKIATFSDLKNIQGMTRVTKMIIQDYIQKDKISTLIFSDHKPEKFNESFFNKEGLEF